MLKNKTNFFLLILAIFIFFSISGCALKEPDNAKRRSLEVLMARDCGFDKLMCCQEDPACSYGQQCCADPNNPSKNYCADDCSCGGEEEFCCANNACNGELACLGGLCVKCGEAGETCCPREQKCSGDLVCANDQCFECGKVGNPCCAGTKACEKGLSVECQGGFCQECGFDGRPACLGQEKCLKGQILMSGRCERCGGPNQPCCQIKSERDYDCDPAQKLRCELGFCASSQEKK